MPGIDGMEEDAVDDSMPTGGLKEESKGQVIERNGEGEVGNGERDENAQCHVVKSDNQGDSVVDEVPDSSVAVANGNRECGGGKAEGSQGGLKDDDPTTEELRDDTAEKDVPLVCPSTTCTP